MDWVKLAVLALDLVGQFVRWVEETKIASAAERAMIERARGVIDANVAKAEAARARVRAELDADHGRLRQPDEFTRPE
jgi:hypothetical protein